MKDADPKCVELARHFLVDYGCETTILADLLAECIQGAVESWIEDWFERGDRPALALIQGGKITDALTEKQEAK